MPTHRNLFAVKLFTVTLFLFALYVSSVYAATFSVSPQTGVYSVGQTFSIRVNVNTGGAPINAADGTLSFNPSELSVLSVSKGPIFNLWTEEPSFSNTNGSVSFSGGSPSGYIGSAGTVLTVALKAKTAGSPKISFTKGSVLAADGKGTNVLTTMNGATFTISAQEATPEAETIIEYVAPQNTPLAPQIVSVTHKDPALWYKEKKAVLSWELPSGVTAVRTLLDNRASSVPTKVYETPIKSIELPDLEEGVQYFHVQFKNADGWGKIAHYRLAIDSEKPTRFDVTLKEGSDLSNPSQTLVYKTEDATSKVRQFKVKIDDKEPFDYTDSVGSSTIALPALSPGYHSVVIEAFDEAGNSLINSLSFTILSFDKPQFTEYPEKINKTVIPVIKGTTRPSANVTVTVSQI